MLLGIPRSARCVQRFDDSLKICNSHYLSQFAAFFIDARAKRSVAESCILFVTFYGHTTIGCDREHRSSFEDLQRVHRCERKKEKGRRKKQGRAHARNESSQRQSFALPSCSPIPFVSIMILPQVHLRKPCYDFYFL